MKHQGFFKRLLIKILKALCIIREEKITKKEMCEQVLVEGICDKDCEHCIWFTKKEGD